MTIEGLGKKFQEARLARNLTLDEAARMTKIRTGRLAPGQAESTAQVSPSASPVSSPKTGQPATTETSPSSVASAPTVAPSASVGPTVVRKAVAAAPSEPEVRKAKPVRPEDVAQAP